MQLLTYAVVVALAIAVGLLNTWAQNPDASAAEKTVLSTALYTVASGAVANGVCAAIARGTRAVEAGDEMGACSPYGFVGAGVAARLHLYWISGYGPAEYEYLRSAPLKTANSLRDGLDRALSSVDLDMKKLGLVRSDQETKSTKP